MGGNVSIIKKLSIVALVITLAMLFCSCASPGANESRSDEVHIAIQPSAAFIPLFVAKEKGWIAKLDEETLTAVAGELGVTREQMDQIIPKFIYSVKIVPEDLDALNDTIWFLNENKILRKEYDIRDRADGSYYKVD